MKSIIKFTILFIALICFSNYTIAQKKYKKKAQTTISKKKKKKPIKKRPTIAKYRMTESKAPESMKETVSMNIFPIKNSIVDTTPNKVVTIVSAFKPQLKNVAKIGFLNATAIVDTNTIVLSYQVPSQNLSFQYQPIALVPRAIRIDSTIKIKQSANVKIGIGNYFNQFIQIEGSHLDQKDQSHYARFINESIEGTHPIQKWNSIGFDYNSLLSINKNKHLVTQAYFNQSNRYRYGLVPDTTILPINNFEQKFTVFGVNVAIANRQFSSKQFSYAPIVKFNHSNLLNQANNIVLDINSPILFNLKRNYKLHFDFNFSFNQYNPLNSASIQNTIFQIDPSIELNKNKYRLNIGVRPTLTNGDFALYPKIELTKQLKDTHYVIDAGWNTSLINNQLIQLIGQNHWISAPNDMPISSVEKKYFNVNYSLNKRFNYGFNMALNDYRELPFFNQTKSLNNPIQEGLRFDVLFEKRAIAIELVGNLRYQFSDKLLWKNHVKYIQFNLIRENTQAWGILPFEFNSQLNWAINKRLQFDASGQFWTGAKTSAGFDNAYQLNNTFVLNTGMQYAINNRWTFWGKGENLLDQQYQRWANYPSLGVQLLAGIQYKFKK
jgi:hypothetical protein